MVLKVTLKRVLLLSAVFLTFSQSVQAEENNNQEGKVIYQLHYDYEPIYNLLKVNKKEYDQYWKEGLSIAEMAKKQGISRRDVEGYFISLHYKEMQKWRKKGALSEFDYFDLVYRLKEHEIEEFINNRNPNNP
ncbi:hypothetical protein SC499_24295 [Peribacillus simplex]|uniref:hypothetical protein n=1 Tax=Peribacillus TaxID=2675229 RepID=UPI00298E2627|nr:hypothetical protein [Peribacillus simplex]MDW7617706.1 hypothetical protein [Peribacillus simplex]MEC0347969.1 hypothetical protein [Peribacillus castrilensis]